MEGPETPQLAAARAARTDLAAERARRPAAAPPAVPDPLPYCIWATVALLAWAFSPALVLSFFASLGAVRYLRAWQAGLRTTSCFLRDPRLVMAYLGILAVAGAAWTVWSLWQYLA